MKIPTSIQASLSALRRPFETLSGVAVSLRAIANHLNDIALSHRGIRPVEGGLATGKCSRQFVIEQSSDRRWRRKIPVTDVLRWRSYHETEGGECRLFLELVCGIRRVEEHEEAVRRMRAAVGDEALEAGVRVARISRHPSLLVGLLLVDKSGASRALHLRDAQLLKAEYGCAGFTDRVLATYTFTGSALEWGDVPTTNDPDQPREGMNVGEVPSIETAPATWAEN